MVASFPDAQPTHAIQAPSLANTAENDEAKSSSSSSESSSASSSDSEDSEEDERSQELLRLQEQVSYIFSL